MKILVCGDSWTHAWGVDQSQAWPSNIGHEVVNVAVCGATNQEIVDQFKSNYNETFDAVIVGWSGATRFKENLFMYEFSSVRPKTIDYFKNKSLDDILNSWEENINEILSLSQVPVLQFSVFGDMPRKEYKNFIDISCLEYLANQQGMFFKYRIPLFEFDWLNQHNLKVTKPFAKKYFGSKWTKACVEREDVRPGKYFFDCGHPNIEGHKQWSSFMKGQVDDLFRK